MIGEGGSGGALALGVTNRILMLEYSSTPSSRRRAAAPSSTATPAKAQKTAEALKLTAQDLAGFGIIDEIVRRRPAAPTATPS